MSLEVVRDRMLEQRQSHFQHPVAVGAGSLTAPHSPAGHYIVLLDSIILLESIGTMLRLAAMSGTMCGGTIARRA